MKDSNHKRIVAITAIIMAIIAVLTFLFGSGVLSSKQKQPIAETEKKEMSYTLVDGNVLSVLPEEERDRLFPWKFVGMVYTDGYPTDTLSEKYEFVGYEDNWNGKLTPGKIWNHYVRQPIEE